MEYGPSLEFRTPTKEGGRGNKDLAFRCGLPLKGGGRLNRNAGPNPSRPLPLERGERVKIKWSPDAAWDVEVRHTTR